MADETGKLDDLSIDLQIETIKSCLKKIELIQGEPDCKDRKSVV